MLINRPVLNPTTRSKGQQKASDAPLESTENGAQGIYLAEKFMSLRLPLLVTQEAAVWYVVLCLSC